MCRKLRISGDTLGWMRSSAAAFWVDGTAGLRNTVRALGIWSTRATSLSDCSQASYSPVRPATVNAAVA
jgi:hypothetical protein